MTWPGLEAGKVESMQQPVHSGQLHGLVELPFQNVLEIPAPQCADTIGVTRASQNTGLEHLTLLSIKHGRPAGLASGDQTFQAVVAIGITPSLDESPAASDVAGDLRCGPALDRQQHASQPVSGLGLTLTADTSSQRGNIVIVTSNDLHPKLP